MCDKALHQRYRPIRVWASAAKWRSATAMAVVVAMLAACGKAAQDNVGSPGQSQQDEAVNPASDYFEKKPGKTGGTLKVSVTQDTGSLNMHAISHTNAEWLGRMIYDNLVYLDDKGRPTPWLAKSWDISADGKIYTFHLRDDVTFSDGAKFNAEAVRINLEHMRDPATKSPLAAAYIAPYIDGRIIDEFTFEARLREPYSPFLHVLAQSWLAILSPKAIVERPREIGDAPVGSGPFIVERYTRQQGIRLVRRADYNWAPDFVRHQGPAYLDRIEIDFVPEAMIRYTSLVAGQYDYTIDAPEQNASSIRADDSLAIDRRIRKGNPYRAITFNVEKAPFDDVRIRRALALAVDRDGIVQMVGFGEFKPKSDFLAANTSYYNPEFQQVLRQNVAEANRLLDEAGWTQRDAKGHRTRNGVSLSAQLLLPDSWAATRTAIAIQGDAKKIGFDLGIVVLPTTQVTDRRLIGDYQAIAAGVWHTNTPDGLYILYHGDEISSSKRIGQNTARLRDARLDDLLQRARQSSNDVELQQLYSEAQRRLTELVPAIPLYENYSLTARKTYVQGDVYDTSHNTPYFPSFWLTAADP